MVMIPSNGRSGAGLTIFAETCARTLIQSHELDNIEKLNHLVLPRAHSTYPSSGPNMSVGVRD